MIGLRHATRSLWCTLLLCASAARAQAPPPDVGPPERQPVADDSVLDEPEDLPSQSYAEGVWWLEVGPSALRDLSDVAVHPVRAEIWAVSSLEGAVWVSIDAGITWFEVLRSLPVTMSGDEQVILDVEARIEELGGGGGPLDISEGLEEEELEALEELADAADAAAQDAIDTMQSELEADPWFIEQRAALEGRADAARPRLWFTRTGLLVSGRADGLRVSVDLGASWVEVLSEPVTSFAERTDGTWVAGTPTGLYSSSNGVAWAPVSSFAGVRVLDLVEDGGLYVATEAGLWFSSDALLYRQLRARVDEVLTVRPVLGPVAAEPAPRALVVGARDTVWRALRPEEPANPVFGGPVVAARDIERIAPDRLVAASEAGVFESLDEGQTWTSFNRGLVDERSRGVAFGPDLLLLAATGGLYRLEPIPAEIDLDVPVLLPSWVPLDALMGSALQRPELGQRVGSRALAAAMPQLTLEYRRVATHGDDWSADRGYTVRDLDGYWQVLTRLRWTPNRQRSTSGSFDLEADGAAVLVLDDEIVVDDGTSLAVLQSKVSRGTTAYRSDLADRVTRLYTARIRLAEDVQRLADRTLLERTERQLRIDEIEAQLDALTDGAVARWRLDPGNLE